jgi:UDP-GlcNAc:undecaprenyl-phosphate/decaprenyl-phosphate GlcNAc-1-phosphate transferase
MQHYLLAFVGSLVAATVLTPCVRALAERLGAVSVPGGRHVNARSIPRLGGLALALGWCGPLLLLLFVHGPARSTLVDHEYHLAALMGGGLALCAVGALDDLRGVRAVHKVLAQALAACLAYALGFRIEAIELPLLGTLPMGVFALPVTVAWIVGITNAVNLIDGLDGLAAGVTFFAAFTNLVVAYLSGSAFTALLMAALMGAVVGFLFFNFNPARIFMGDSGSYFLGYLLATSALAGGVQQKASTAVSLLVPVIALGLPIFDTLFSMVRRYLERRPLFSPDRGHIHHRLLELGLTHRRSVMLLYGVSIVFAAGAIAVSLGRSWEVGLALTSVSLVLFALIRFLGYFEYLHFRRRQKSRFYDRHTDRLRFGVPELILSLSRATSEEAVLSALERSLGSCDLHAAWIMTDEQTLHRWERSSTSLSARNLLRTTYPIGRDDRARARVGFAWASDVEDPDPQADILLQLLTDAVTQALERAGSSLAPERLTEPPPLHTAEVVASSSL